MHMWALWIIYSTQCERSILHSMWHTLRHLANSVWISTSYGTQRHALCYMAHCGTQGVPFFVTHCVPFDARCASCAKVCQMTKSVSLCAIWRGDSRLMRELWHTVCGCYVWECVWRYVMCETVCMCETVAHGAWTQCVRQYTWCVRVCVDMYNMWDSVLISCVRLWHAVCRYNVCDSMCNVWERV